MKKIILSSYIMMSAFIVCAQTQGVVLDIDNKPVQGVDVYLLDQEILLNTDQNGSFTCDLDIPNNSYINFYKQGYASQLVKYQDGFPLKVIFKRLHVGLDEVGVVASFNELGNSKLTNIEKKTLDFLTSNSMVESITSLSGVDMISSGLGIQKVVVRGLSGMRVVTYLNGMQINNQQWANDHGIGFTDLGLKDVELIKGSSALKYGAEAIGGVLYFKDAPFISNRKLEGYVATKFNNSSYLSSNHFGIKWGKQNLSFNLYGQYSLSSDYRLPNYYYLFNSRFKQNAVKFSVLHRYKKMKNVFRYHMHNESPGIPAHSHAVDPANIELTDIASRSLDLKGAFRLLTPYQQVNNQLFIYEMTYLIDNLKFSFNAGHFINNLKEYEKWTRPAFDLTLSNTQIMPNIRYQMKDFTFNLGSQISMLDNKNNIDERLVPDASSINIGPFLIVDYEKNNIGFNTGLRHDYKNLKSSEEDYENTFANTSFSTGLYYKFIENIIRITYSGAFRSPHFAELFSDGVHHGTNRYEIGDRNLKIEHANQFDLKYQWANDHFGFVFNPFLQNISDFISINPTDSFNGAYRVYNYTQYNQVEIKGVEMNLHYHPHQLHNLHLEQSYSFLETTTNKDSEYGLALTPANSIKTKMLFDFGKYDKLSKYKLDYVSINHRYKFKQESFAEYEELTESYTVVSLQLGLRLNDKFKCTIGVHNLLNESYSPHTSRIRGVAGGVPDPGRHMNINLKYDF